MKFHIVGILLITLYFQHCLLLNLSGVCKMKQDEKIPKEDLAGVLQGRIFGPFSRPIYKLRKVQM